MWLNFSSLDSWVNMGDRQKQIKKGHVLPRVPNRKSTVETTPSKFQITLRYFIFEILFRSPSHESDVQFAIFWRHVPEETSRWRLCAFLWWSSCVHTWLAWIGWSSGSFSSDGCTLALTYWPMPSPTLHAFKQVSTRIDGLVLCAFYRKTAWNGTKVPNLAEEWRPFLLKPPSITGIQPLGREMSLVVARVNGWSVLTSVLKAFEYYLTLSILNSKCISTTI